MKWYIWEVYLVEIERKEMDEERRIAIRLRQPAEGRIYTTYAWGNKQFMFQLVLENTISISVFLSIGQKLFDQK